MLHHRLNPYAVDAYDGINLNPLEVVFIKVKSFLLQAKWTAPVTSQTYDRWASHEVTFFLRVQQYLYPFSATRWFGVYAYNSLMMSKWTPWYYSLSASSYGNYTAASVTIACRASQISVCPQATVESVFMLRHFEHDDCAGCSSDSAKQCLRRPHRHLPQLKDSCDER